MFANKQYIPTNNSIRNSCRTCMKSSNLLSINEKIINFLQNISGLNFMENDALPQNICERCAEKINEIFEFIEQCKQTDLSFKSLLESKNVVIKEEFIEIKTEVFDDFLEIKEEIIEDIPETSELPTVQRKKPKKRSNTCDICHKTFTLRCNMLRHQLIHLDTRPYQCQKCDKGFIQSSDLRQHERTHEKNQEKTCHLCDRTFKYACHLKHHLMKHNGEKSHFCDICGKGVTTNTILERHKKLHGKKGNIMCQKCGHVFKSRKSLKTHLYRNTCLALKLEVS